MEKLYKKISEKYRTMQNFCDKIGVSRTVFYNMYEKGQVRKTTLEKIAEGLGVTYEDMQIYAPDAYEKIQNRENLKQQKLEKEEELRIKKELKRIEKKKLLEQKRKRTEERMKASLERQKKVGGYRTKLKLKILDSFGTIVNFCKSTGIPTQTIEHLYTARAVGTYDTWIKVQIALEIPDEEMWKYFKKEVSEDAN